VKPRKAVKQPPKAKARPARGSAKAKKQADTLALLGAPITNEYTTPAADAADGMAKVKAAAIDGVPESPLAVIDTATHAALVAVNPTPSTPSELRPSRYPRSKSTPPFLATIAPRNVFLPDRVIVDVEGDTFPSTKLDEHGRDERILPPATLEAIRAKASVAHRYLEGGDARSAYDAYLAAFELVPTPFENWNAAGWLLVAMAECAMRADDHARSFAALRDAMHCPGTVGNPWVHLRLGQVRLELADERAADDLARAYIGGGRALFEGLDPKYFAVVEKSLEPPPGHDRLA
jgi:hypothetical protein